MHRFSPLTFTFSGRSLVPTVGLPVKLEAAAAVADPTLATLFLFCSHVAMTIRIESDDDNGERGFKQLTRDELRELIEMWLILIPAGTKKRYATGADSYQRAARRQMADALLDRLMHYPTFGPARSRPAHGPPGPRAIQPDVDPR
jgi:hypothetical protein